MATQPVTPSLSARIEHLRMRPLGVEAPQVPDKRPAQAPPKLDILVHDCFEQRAGVRKPPCKCSTHVGFLSARILIERGQADWLLYTRKGKQLQNRKVLVLTATYVKHLAHSQDALNHKLALSLSGFKNYHIAPITSEARSGLDREINLIRLQTIHERKKQVESYRDYRVVPQGNGPDAEKPSQRFSAPDLNYAGSLPISENPYCASDDKRTLPPAVARTVSQTLRKGRK